MRTHTLQRTSTPMKKCTFRRNSPIAIVSSLSYINAVDYLYLLQHAVRKPSLSVNCENQPFLPLFTARPKKRTQPTDDGQQLFHDNESYEAKGALSTLLLMILVFVFYTRIEESHEVTIAIKTPRNGFAP